MRNIYTWEKFKRTVSNEWVILLVCIVAFILRIKALDHQSLWVDELQTMHTSNPSASWGEMFHNFKAGENHPPLFFILERIFFSLFGYTAFVARFIPAIAGTLGVWAMYRLGKAILDKELGIICAILTCINFFVLSYSQEARPYSLAFLFAALSFTWFIKLLKSPSKKNAILYTVCTFFLLYTHYYSLFVVMAQVLLGLLFMAQEEGQSRKRMLLYFVYSWAALIIAYAPWYSFLGKIVAIRSFWIKDISPGFMQDFFFEYFGNAAILNPLLLLLLFVFFARVAMSAGTTTIKKIKEEPILLTFTIIIFWVFILFCFAYIWSLLVVPMLYPRYTIVLLPAIILAMAYSIGLFKLRLLKYSLLTLFVLLSVIHLFFVKDYYTAVSKTQFREMTQYVVNVANFPIINEHTNVQQGYYLKLFGSEAEMLTGKKEDILDSVLHKTSEKYNLDGFWLVGAHGDQMPAPYPFNGLDTAYSLIEQQQFHDAWAQLYASKINKAVGFYNFRFNDFPDGEGARLADQKQLALWNGSIHSKSIILERGRFKMIITATGTAAAGVFPHLNILINGKKIADYFVTGKMEPKEFVFDNGVNASTAITIEMDNDILIPEKKEDRNVFLESIVLKKVN